MKVSRISVGKGRTTRPSDSEEWLREYYELEMEISDDKEVPSARDWASTQIDSWLSELEPKPKAEAERKAPKEILADVESKFPDDLRQLLTFDEDKDFILIKPKQYLGSDNFSKVAAIARNLDGMYISAGPDSHFKISKKGTPVPAMPEFDPEELVKHDWKGRKTNGEYAEGSLSFGWDFADQFSPDIISVLKKGVVTIDQYEFSLSTSGTLVQTRKKKKEG